MKIILIINDNNKGCAHIKIKSVARALDFRKKGLLAFFVSNSTTPVTLNVGLKVRLECLFNSWREKA